MWKKLLCPRKCLRQTIDQTRCLEDHPSHDLFLNSCWVPPTSPHGLVKVKVAGAQLCPTFATPCSPSGSSVHGTLQARTLEWVAISSSRGSFWSRYWTRVSCIAGRFFTIEPTGKPLLQGNIPYTCLVFWYCAISLESYWTGFLIFFNKCVHFIYLFFLTFIIFIR